MELTILTSYLLVIGVTIACFYVEVPIQLNIAIHSTWLIIIGSYNSVKFMVRDKISKTDFSGDESIVEAVGMTEAYQFPIIGGGVLLSLYALSKAFGPTVLNYVLLLYFVFVGMESFKGILNNYTFIGKIKQDEKVKNLKSPMLFHNVHLLGVNFSLSGFDILCLVCSALCALIYVLTKHWATNNFLAIIFTLFAVENMFLSDFKVGAVMLIGLFFYDIFFVFGTDVMETVAKNVDGPIKLLFPKIPNVTQQSDMSLLGLGDIVIPGIFIALWLRYDFLREFNSKAENRTYNHVMEGFKKLSKPYFWTCIVGYVIGMITTVAVMLITKRGQPALLYLVPSCLLSVAFWAFIRGEISKIYSYSEDETIQIIYAETKALAGHTDKKHK